MTKIISMSLNKELLKEIDDAQKSMGFKGRSEVIRSSMKLLLNDIKEKENLKGHAECVMISVHGKKNESSFTKSTHKYDDIIVSQVHNNLCNDKCLEILVLHGNAEKISRFFSELRTNKHAEYVKLIVP